MEQEISYFAHEGMMARMERMNHRLWIVVIVLIIALIVTNLAWVLYEGQFESYQETVQTVKQDSGDGGINRFVGGSIYVTADGNNDN